MEALPMKWRVLNKLDSDFQANIERLKVAYSKAPADECQETIQCIETGECSFYQVQSDNCNVLFVGEAFCNGEYFIHALVGHGLHAVANEMIDKITKAGFTVISYVTYKKGMTRILSKFNFRVCPESNDEAYTLLKRG